MIAHIPRLPFALDPLIAEAKRRARQRWALLAAAVVLAGGATTAAGFFAYLHYHGTEATPVGPVKVIFATRRLIPAGTPGDLIRTAHGHYKISTLAKKFVQAGAIHSPAALAGKVALTDIVPGQQLTTADFGPCTCILTPTPGHQHQWDVTVPLSSSDTVGRQVTAGSHIDIWFARSSTTHSRSTPRLLYRNVYVVGVNHATVTFRALPPYPGNLLSITLPAYRNYYRLALRLDK